MFETLANGTAVFTGWIATKLLWVCSICIKGDLERGGVPLTDLDRSESDMPEIYRTVIVGDLAFCTNGHVVFSICDPDLVPATDGIYVFSASHTTDGALSVQMIRIKDYKGGNNKWFKNYVAFMLDNKAAWFDRPAELLPHEVDVLAGLTASQSAFADLTVVSTSGFTGDALRFVLPIAQNMPHNMTKAEKFGVDGLVRFWGRMSTLMFNIGSVVNAPPFSAASKQGSAFTFYGFNIYYLAQALQLPGGGEDSETELLLSAFGYEGAHAVIILSEEALPMPILSIRFPLLQMRADLAPYAY